MSKSALVVDDSRVARHVLTNLLADHGIAADTAESAEAALEYLRQRRPDVIFMDHAMPGMDGFQALEAIKTNPATATIPVMMYTSMEGELYVGQARALGAFGVLPKALKPVEVEQVLKALNLIPGDRAHDPDPPVPLSESTGGRRVQELLEELFHQQRSALREEIREGYERALASTQTHLQTIAAPPASGPMREIFRPTTVAAVVFGALAILFGYLYFNVTRLLQETTQRSSDLITSSAQLSAANAQALGTRTSLAATDPQAIELIEWAANLDSGYGFDEIPLNEARAESLLHTIKYAASVGFDGRFLLRVHVGRFCMSFGPNAVAQLAPPALPATQCEQIGWLPSEAFARGRRQTLAFANAVVAATSGTRIRIETVSVGADEPAIAYPTLTESLSAGEWNRIAASNQRIEIRLVPDAPADAQQ